MLLLGAVAVVPLSWEWRAAGGALLLALWLGTLLKGPGAARVLRLLPGHALLFWAVGQTRAALGLYLWVTAMALTLVVLSGRSWARPFWAILWPVLMGTMQQVGAQRLRGPALAAWTAALAALALALTAREGRMILRAQRGERC